MDWRIRKLGATLGLGVLIVAALLSSLQPGSAVSIVGQSRATSTLPPALTTRADLPQTPSPVVTRSASARGGITTTTAAGSDLATPAEASAEALVPRVSGGAAPTALAAAGSMAPTLLPRTLNGSENDQSTWQEYRLLSWGITFRYPQSWQVILQEPQTPGDPEAIDIQAGGRTLRLLHQAPGRDLTGSVQMGSVTVGPVQGERHVWQGAQGNPSLVVIVPEARRDVVGLVEYHLLGGAEDTLYMALFDAVLSTLRYDVGITPTRSDLPFAPYSPGSVSLPGSYRGYSLPLDLSTVSGLDQHNLTPTQQDALAANGFFVAPGTEQTFDQTYRTLRGQGRSIFVTSDSALYAYQLLMGKVQRTAEREQLAPALLRLSQALLASAQSAYQGAQGSAAEGAAARALAFFAVAVRLQDPQAAIPSAVQSTVQQELSLIAAHQGVAASPLFARPGAEAHLQDYSQFEPRGHYAADPALAGYFEAMTWYGSVNLRLSDREETRTALIIVQILANTRVGSQQAFGVWESIYEPMTFFVGHTDDLNAYDYRNLCTSLFGGLSSDPLFFADEGRLNVFINSARAFPAPKINSVWVEPGQDPAAASLGWRFMGPRYALDADVLGQLTWDHVGTQSKPRILPQGLDLAAAMGSDEAYQALTDEGETAYDRYPAQMAQVRQSLSALPQAAWTQNLYWGTLSALQPLVDAKDARYPAFMRTQAWARKDLQTMLGSWAELKHDTVLSAKQANDTGVAAPLAVGAPGYVEPDPELYARLAALTQMTENGLSSRSLLEPADRAALEQLQSMLAQLQTIAEHELAGQTLTSDEETFIGNYGDELQSLTLAAADGPVGANQLNGAQAAVITDVTTGGPSVLEEATGRIGHIYVVIEAGGKLYLAEGGVYSYYEFPWPASERLTDDQWRSQLDAQQAPPQPEWVQTFTIQ